MKGTPTIMVDYILDRNGRSHTVFEHSLYNDFRTKRAQYTRAGVLSEIIISPKIKNIVASREVQELARKYGFDGIPGIPGWMRTQVCGYLRAGVIHY